MLLGLHIVCSVNENNRLYEKHGCKGKVVEGQGYTTLEHSMT